MFWERVSEEIYLFTSDRYALVNSVAVITSEGLVVIDALPFPDEAQQIARFLQVRTGSKVRFQIVTHHHMDHVYGVSTYSTESDVIAHELCRQKLLQIGEKSLQEARKNDPIFEKIQLRIPTITFEEELTLCAGSKVFRLIHLPGHTSDNIGVFIEDDRVLMTGDAVMAIPIIADGDCQQAIESIQRIKELAPETVVQGHGEVILRGEVQSVLERYITYLTCVQKKAQKILRDGKDRKLIWDIPLEDCGLERVPLGIASHRLHIANILSIYDRLKAAQEK